MDKLFMFLSNQYVLSIVTILGFLLAIIAIFVTRKYRKVKILSLSEWKNVELLGFPLRIRKDLSVKFKGKEIDNLYELKIKLKNYGTVVLKEDDFDTLPRITFNSDVKILDVCIVSKENYLNPSYNINNGTIVIGFNFIEPKDIIEIKILYASKGACGGKISGKIIGGNKLQNSFESEIQLKIYKESNKIGKLSYFLIYIILFLAFIAIMLKMNINNGPFIIIFSFILSLIISLLLGEKIRETVYDKKMKKYISEGRVVQLPKKKK